MRRAPAFAAALLLAAGCARCAAPPTRAAPERHLPATAPFLLVVPMLEPAVRDLAALKRTLASIPAAAQLDEAFQAVKLQLGFDPLEPSGLDQAGIDPRGGGGVAFGPGPPLLLLPVADAARFEATLQRLARDRLGASVRSAEAVSGRRVTVFRREGSPAPAMAWMAVGSLALVSAGPESPRTVAEAAALPAEQALAGSPHWRVASAFLGNGYPIQLLAPARSPVLSDVPAAYEGAALGLRAGAASLSARAALLLGPERAPAWRALAGAGPEAAARAGTDEVARLPSDASLVIRFGGDPVALGRRLVPRLPRRVSEALLAARLDLERDLLGALAPGAALSVSLAPTFTVEGLSSSRLGPGSGDPFRLVGLDGLARVRDPARFKAFLARLGLVAPRWGARLTGRATTDGGSWKLSLGAARLACSLSGERLAVAGGPDRLEPLSRRAAAGGPGYAAPTRASRAALASGVAAAVLDVRNAVAAVRALPQEAYGTGPDGFVTRSLVDRFLEPASRLEAVSLRLDVTPEAALIDLEIEGREAGEGPQP